MSHGNERWQIRTGATVHSADGDEVGKVIAVEPRYIVVEKGFFFPSDYYIPASAIASVAGEDVYLNVTKDDALNSGWDQEPVADYSADHATATGTITPGFDAAGGDPAAVAAGETIRVPVHEEELVARTREVEKGEVRIEKDVVAQEQVVEVPVTEERVRVTRHAVDRDASDADTAAFRDEVIEVPVHAEEVELGKRVRVTRHAVDRDASDADTAAFRDEVIEVPVHAEEVELGKRVRVAEEVEVGKEQVQRTERAAGTVRREEVRVEDATVDPGTSDSPPA
jgi:stress response protein YsnF